jgi:DNA repair protein RecO (recombination protein O)
MRWFDLHLLSLTGFQPQLFYCLGCEEPLRPVVNYLCLHEGGVCCPTCGQQRADVEALEADVLKVLRFLQSRPWDEVQKVMVRTHILRQVETILYRYLLNVLERHLKSTDFLRKLQTMFRS